MTVQVEVIILLRAALAALLGYLIGWERKVIGAPIRSRMVALAAMTAASLVALTEAYYPDETARVVAGVVTGIGFLGAGAILRSPSGEVTGLTTAASLWAMSAVGMAVGSGNELLGVGLTLVVYAIIGISDWPLLTQLARYRAQKEAEAAGSEPCQPLPQGEASKHPPTADGDAETRMSQRKDSKSEGDERR